MRRGAALLFAFVLFVSCGDDDAAEDSTPGAPSTTQNGDPTLDDSPEDGATPGGSSGADSGGTGSGRGDDEP